MGEVGDKLKDYTIIQEGEAQILMHTKNTVFYNKAQVNNRDMSIAILRTFIEKRKEEHAAMLAKKGKSEIRVHETSEEATAAQVEATNGDCSLNAKEPMSEQVSAPKEPVSSASWKDKREMKAPKVLEALAASGLRAIRYALEVEDVGQVVAVDNDKDSVEACKKNIKFNGSVACAKVEAHHADARIYMLTHEKEFDVVDLDPYGTPSVFLDSAVQSVAEGGLLMCTATDMAVLCGNTGEVCYTKYGSYPVKGKYCHEMALRILLACIESHANRYKRYIVPVLSVHMDFYVRVFVRIYTSASEIKNTPLKLSYVYQCVGCDSFHLQSVGRTVIKDKSVKHMPGTGPVVSQVCSDCGKKYNMGGPIWSAPMHDQDWVLSALANIRAREKKYPAFEKICAVLTTVSEELHDVPLFVCLHSVCATLKCTSPTAVMFRSAVINAGYRISGSHVSPLALKTDAPMNVIWDIMRCWVKNHPVKGQQQGQPESSGTAILSKEPTLQANFSRAGASFSKAQAKKAARFLPNPERHWGPKVRAGRQITSKHVSLLGPEALNAVQSSNKGREKDVPDLSSGKVDENSESASPVTKRQKCDNSATES